MSDFAVFFARGFVMPASTSTSVKPSVYVSRAGKHIEFAYGKDVTVDDLIAAVKRLEAQRAGAHEPAPVTPTCTGSVNPQGTEAAPRPAAFSLLRSLSRPGTAAPEIDAAWEEMPTRGPADLIRHFAVAALYEHHPELRSFDDSSYRIVLDAVEFAVDVAVRLAGVSDNWLDDYRALTAYLRP
jgi:hypothetical protein